MPGMCYNAGNENARLKYSGKPFDEEMGLNKYHFGFREYDPELGRWNRPDPLYFKNPNESPYNFVSNNPINFYDIYGLDKRPSGLSQHWQDNYGWAFEDFQNDWDGGGGYSPSNGGFSGGGGGGGGYTVTGGYWKKQWYEVNVEPGPDDFYWDEDLGWAILVTAPIPEYIFEWEWVDYRLIRNRYQNDGSSYLACAGFESRALQQIVMGIRDERRASFINGMQQGQIDAGIVGAGVGITIALYPAVKGAYLSACIYTYVYGGAAIGTGVGVIGALTTRIGFGISPNNYLRVSQSVLQQRDAFHLSTTFLRNQVLRTMPQIQNYNTLWYSTPGTVNGHVGLHTIGINPWTRLIYHECFFKP